MICPDCGSEQTHVVKTEPRKSGTVVYRRRECEACGERWSTWEILRRSVEEWGL